MRAKRRYGYVNWYHFIAELKKQFDWQFTQLRCVNETKDLRFSGTTIYQVDNETEDQIHNVYLGSNAVLVISVIWKLDGIAGQYYEKDEMSEVLAAALQDFVDEYNKSSETNIIMKYCGDYNHKFVCCTNSFKIDGEEMTVRSGEIIVDDIESFKKKFIFVKKWYEYDLSRKRQYEGRKLFREQTKKMWQYNSFKKGNGLLVKLSSSLYIYSAPTDIYLN